MNVGLVACAHIYTKEIKKKNDRNIAIIVINHIGNRCALRYERMRIVHDLQYV